MLKSSSIIFLTAIIFSCSYSTGTASLSEEESMQIETEAKELANKWLASWNGVVDSEEMMATYHPGMKYAWRGNSPLGTYDETREFAESLSREGTDFQLTMSNVDFTLIDKNHVVVFFQFDDQNKSPFGVGAASLVMTKSNGEWKII